MTILRSRSIKSLFIALASTALAFLFLSLTPTPAHASTSDTIYGYAWSPNIGWISMNNCTSDGACAPVGYGVTMPTSGSIRNLSGYGWSSNIGWVSFNAASTTGCPTLADNTDCQAQVNWDTGEVKGWARACSVFASGCSGALKNDGAGNDIYRGGWDGFISLADTNTGDRAVFGVSVDVGSGIPARFGGFAWGANVIGWVDFSGVTYDPHTYECSDGIDNSDAEDTLIDAADRGCHTDFNASNPLTYVPTDPDESDTICPPHTYPDPLGDPNQPKDCYYCPNLAGGPYTSIPAGYQLAPDGISCITIPDPICAPGQPCWCEDPAHADDNECKEICLRNPSLPQCTICKPGQPCWCANGAHPDDEQCKECAINPTGLNCPTGTGGGQCSNIPDDVEIALGVGVPPTRPYRQLADGRCLCVAGYVLNGQYKCVKPTYCELGGNCN